MPGNSNQDSRRSQLKKDQSSTGDHMGLFFPSRSGCLLYHELHGFREGGFSKKIHSYTDLGFRRYSDLSMVAVGKKEDYVFASANAAKGKFEVEDCYLLKDVSKKLGINIQAGEMSSDVQHCVDFTVNDT
uniref:Uncharacterized protein n=1 Tax=Dicentrarchus labrax TaxID=13489 RepID=A0A8P4K824_DICLA